MDSSLLQLEDYGLTDIAIKWEPATPESADATAAAALSYQVSRQVEEPRRYKLTLHFRHTAAAVDGKSQLSIRASLVGFFLFPEAVPLPEREKAIRVNGLTILYGALRGLMLPIAAAFPPGFRYVLPAVNMLQVIKATEEKNRTASVAREKSAKYRQSGKKEAGGMPIRTPKP